MSHYPATPSNAGKHAVEALPESAMPCTEKPTPTSKIAQASLYEPSPASTYGDTAGSSAPATPLTPEELGDKKRTYWLYPSMLSMTASSDAFRGAFAEWLSICSGCILSYFWNNCA